MVRISVCMITKDEEAYLDACLRCVKELANEIIIVDTGSTDDTIEIAQAHGAKVHHFEWCDDFSAARNESLKHATGDWILVIDADELLEPAHIAQIKSLVKDKEAYAFSFDQRSYLRDIQKKAQLNESDFEPIKEYPYYASHRLVRLFRNGKGFAFKNRVHEIVEHSIEEQGYAPAPKLEIILHHLGTLKQRDVILKKAAWYSRLILKQFKEDPNNHRYAYQAAQLALGQKKYADALKLFLHTARLKPNYKLVWAEIGKLYAGAREFDKAIDAFSKAMHYSPNNPSPANNLAVLYIQLERYPMAKALLERELKKHPNNKALKHNYEKLQQKLN